MQRMKRGLLLTIAVLLAITTADLRGQGRSQVDTSWTRVGTQGRWGQRITLDADFVVWGSGGFGKVEKLAPMADGGVAILDVEPVGAPLVVLGADGRQRFGVGRFGEGPGEFGRAISITGTVDGGLAIYEGSRTRLTVWNSHGRLVGTYSAAGHLSPTGQHAIRALRDGTIAIWEQVVPAGSNPAVARWGDPFPMLFLFRYRSGKLDKAAGEPKAPAPIMLTPFASRVFRASDSRGNVVSATGDRMGFASHRPGAAIATGYWQDVEPVEVMDPERAELELYRQTLTEHSHPMFLPPSWDIPTKKPLVTQLAVDLSDRVWLRRSTPGERGEPRLAYKSANGHTFHLRYSERTEFEVFSGDGAFLGVIELPMGITDVAFGTEFVWGVLTGQDGVQGVARFSMPR